MANENNKNSAGYSEEPEEDKFSFCTECENELEKFGYDPDEIDLTKVRSRFNNCVKIGKFKGDICARLFIAHDEDLSGLWDEDD